MARRTPKKRFQNVHSVRAYTSRVLRRLEEATHDKELDNETARTMLYGAKVMADLITKSELEERIARLEAAARDHNASEAESDAPH